MVQSEKFSPAAQTGIHIVIEFLRLRIPPLFPILHQQGGGILVAGGILTRSTPDAPTEGVCECGYAEAARRETYFYL